MCSSDLNFLNDRRRKWSDFYFSSLPTMKRGGDPLVQLRLSQAVAALTGLGSDRISICQGTN